MAGDFRVGLLAFQDLAIEVPGGWEGTHCMEKVDCKGQVP